MIKTLLQKKIDEFYNKNKKIENQMKFKQTFQEKKNDSN